MTDLNNIINPLTRLFAITNNTMNPAMLALLASLIEEAVKDAPAVYQEFQLIFNNPDPTPADWQALRTKLMAKSYRDYVPDTALPPDNVVQLPKAPETSAAAAAAPETSAVQPAPQIQQTPPAAAPAPFLPDGSKNPEFNHLP